MFPVHDIWWNLHSVRELEMRTFAAEARRRGPELLTARTQDPQALIEMLALLYGLKDRPPYKEISPAIFAAADYWGFEVSDKPSR